jgi:hypothetical protein
MAGPIEGYLTNHCQHCGGGIEFPKHGVGAEIECPHCNRPIRLIPPCEPEAANLPESSSSAEVGLSRAGLLLLSKFISPREVDALGSKDYWKSVLEDDLAAVVDGFLHRGLLEQVTPDLIWLLRSRPSNELKVLAAKRGLGQSGNRETLAKRLVRSDPEEMARLFRGRVYLACTHEGGTLVENFLQAEAEAKRDAEARCLAAVRERRFEDAIQIVAALGGKRGSGMGEQADHQSGGSRATRRVLDLIFTQLLPRHAGLDEPTMLSIHTAAAMMELWGTNDPRPWLAADPRPEQVDRSTEARMLLSGAWQKFRIEEMQRAGIKRAEILPPSDEDVCPACRAHGGRVYSIEELPELPCEGCSCETGCRCIALARE